MDHKILSASGGLRPLAPHQGLCPWTPLGAQPHTPIIGSRSRVRHPAPPEMKSCVRPCCRTSIGETFFYNFLVTQIVRMIHATNFFKKGQNLSTLRPKYCWSFFPDTVYIHTSKYQCTYRMTWHSGENVGLMFAANESHTLLALMCTAEFTVDRNLTNVTWDNV